MYFIFWATTKTKTNKLAESFVSIAPSHVNITKLLLSGCPTSTLEVYNTVGEPDYQTAHVCVWRQDTPCVGWWPPLIAGGFPGGNCRCRPAWEQERELPSHLLTVYQVPPVLAPFGLACTLAVSHCGADLLPCCNSCALQGWTNYPKLPEIGCQLDGLSKVF